MKRRHAIRFAIGASVVARAPLLRAQSLPASLRRVGVLAPSTAERDDLTLEPFYEQMRQLGWVEGQNIAYDRVYADDRHEVLLKLAAELVARRPEVIFAPPVSSALAAKQATQTIPIVFATVPDPVGMGLVTSLARPGGNVTGISSIGASLFAKRVELLNEILPGAKRIGLLVDPTDPTTRLSQQAIAPLVASSGLTLIIGEAANPADFDVAIAKLIAGRADVIFSGSVLAFNMRVRLIELANRKRLPVVGVNSRFTDAGALFAYGPLQDDQHRRSALLVDKILKGANPADLPVEQPTLFELVINLKAAKALGITVPRSVLLRANRVIE